MVIAESGPAIAAIGNFDGVHLGHQYLIAETAKIARRSNAACGAVVFNPHPRRFFQPDAPAFLLTTPDRRNNLLKTHGVEKIFVLTFNAALAAATPQEFVFDVLKSKLGLRGVVTGAEFQFGKGRTGDAAALAALCKEAGMSAHQVEPQGLSERAEKIGSSGVRQALRDGDVKAAAAMLGRFWSVAGVVDEGRKLGRTIGFPTANLTLGDLIEPRYGVYAVRVAFQNKTYNGVANFGRRPTVGADAPLLEVHLFDFDGDLYNREIDVYFVQFIRPEHKFDGVAALKEQIAKDSEQAKSLLAN